MAITQTDLDNTTLVQLQLTGTQSMAAIQKSHDTQSSASEIDDSVKHNTSKTVLKINNEDMFNDGGYYNDSGALISHSDTKYSDFVKISGLTSLEVFAEPAGSASTVFFEEDKTTLVHSFVNTGVKTTVDLSSIPSAYYVAFSTGVDLDAYAILNKEYSLYSISNKVASIERYPFSNGEKIEDVLIESILDVEIFDAELNQQFTMAVFVRDSNGTSQIKIYEWVNDSFGSSNAVWSKNNYVPSADIEVLTLSGSFDAKIKIDWSKFLDGTSFHSQGYNTAGLSSKTYKQDPSKVNKFNDLLSERYPFNNTDNMDANIVSGIINVLLYNPNPSKTYSLAVFSKNVSGSWTARIYEAAIGGGFGSSVQWNETNYTPSQDIEVIELTGSDAMTAKITVDWSKIPDGTSFSGKDYSTYGLSIETYKYAVPSNADNKFSVVLPSVINIPSSKTLWMYDYSIMKNSILLDKSHFDLDINSSISSSITKNGDFTIIDGANQTLTLTVRDLSNLSNNNNNNLISILDTNIIINSKTPASSIDMGTLVIADSYFDIAWGDGIFEYMKQFAEADGNSITYKGTRTSYGNMGEAYAGWAENDFITRYVPTAQREDVNGDSASSNMSSPFMFSTDDTDANKYLSFSDYISSNSISGIDNVIFFLGMNGGDGSGINTMISNLKSALPNVNVIVAMIPPQALLKQGVDTTASQLNRETVNLKYLSLFDNRSNDNIYVAPTMASFNREFGLINSTISSVQYPTEVPQNTDITIATNHHPTSLGAKVLGKTIYDLLLYINS